MAEIKLYNRTRLLRLLHDKNVSAHARSEIMLLWGNFKTQAQKEKAAEKLYPIIENITSDEEALNAVEELVEQSIPYNRAKLLNLFAEKNFSAQTSDEVLHLFNQIDPGKKGDVLTKLYLLVESSNTEAEALEGAELIIKQYRTLHLHRLLELTAEKQFCIGDDVRSFVQKLPIEKREETAAKLYSIVAGCQTEDEAYDAVKQVVQQILGK